MIKLSKNSDFHHYLCSGVGGIWRGRDGRSSSTGASMFGAVRVLRSLKSCARPRKGKYNDYNIVCDVDRLCCSWVDIFARSPDATLRDVAAREEVALSPVTLSPIPAVELPLLHQDDHLQGLGVDAFDRWKYSQHSFRGFNLDQSKPFSTRYIFC